MKKILATLGLLALLSAPVLAQGVTVVRPSEPVQSYSTGMAAPVQIQQPCNICPTGMAAPIQIQQPCPTGMAVPVQIQQPCNACPTPTGYAAPVGPLYQRIDIPKKHFWQRNRTEYTPVNPFPTGYAAPINPCPCPAVSAPCTTPLMNPAEEVQQRLPVKTGAAAPMQKPVKGCW